MSKEREGRIEKEEDRSAMGRRKESAIHLLWQSWTLKMAQLVMKLQLSTDFYSESWGY